MGVGRLRPSSYVMRLIIRDYSDTFFMHMEKILKEKACKLGKVPPVEQSGLKKVLDGLIPRARRLRQSTYLSVPVITNIQAINVTASSATITWKTDKFADGTVWYDAVDPLPFTSSTPMVSSMALVTEHDFTISGLKSGTTYYFMVASSDVGRNMRASGQLSFKTLPN